MASFTFISATYAKTARNHDSLSPADFALG
jgi:hypothetical protein